MCGDTRNVNSSGRADGPHLSTENKNTLGFSDLAAG